MIHPFMPYVTEELWQRLPRRPKDINPTITKAAYPRYNASLDDPAAEEAYDLVFAVVKAIRSLASEYSIKDNIVVYVQCSTALTHSTITTQKQSIAALTKGLDDADLTVLAEEEEHPEGCAPQAVSKDVSVYLLVKGRVDVDAEIKKAKAKLGKVEEARRRLEKSMAAKDYLRKVKESVQAADGERVQGYKAEEDTLRGVIGKFEGLRV